MRCGWWDNDVSVQFIPNEVHHINNHHQLASHIFLLYMTLNDKPNNLQTNNQTNESQHEYFLHIKCGESYRSAILVLKVWRANLIIHYQEHYSMFLNFTTSKRCWMTDFISNRIRVWIASICYTSPSH